jgi:TP901 family phage tail tape measure protein
MAVVVSFVGEWDGKAIKNAMRDLKEAEKSVLGFGGRLQNFGSQLQSLGGSISGVGKSLSLGVTAPIIGIGTAAVIAATKFESAFAGVRKTVDATEEEFADLERGIRDMSLRLPASAEAIAAVGEAAGQLGIDTKNILSFTEIMINLGEATNLSATDAASALARLANITQMPQTEFDKLGSSIVALGNNLATTEAEIVEMALRIAGAGKQIGLTEAQMLGFSGALSSVGIEAAAGGSAISKIMLKMQKDVLKGGKGLETLATIAGVSAKEFAKQFQESPAEAIVAFIAGLQKIEAAGGDVVGALESVGFTELRTRDALLRLVGAGDLLSESLDISSQAWQDNTALATEAEQRYATTESQLAILRNRASEFARTLGEALVPILISAIDAAQPFLERIQGLATAFTNLSPATQQMIFGILAVAAAIGPILIVVGKLISAIGGIILVAVKVAAVMSGVGLAIAAVVVAVAALVAGILYLWNNSEEFREAVLRIWENIKAAVVTVIDMIKTKLEENSETIEKLKVAFQKMADFIMTYVVPILMTFIEEYLKIVVQVLLLIVQGILKIIETFIQFQAALVVMWESIATFVTNAKERFDDLQTTVSTVWDGILTTITTTLDKVKDAVRGAINFIIRGWNRLSFTVPGVTLPNGTTFGGFSISVPKIEELAKGGLVMGPTLALIGEAGPEMVLPLTGRAAEQAGVNTGGNSYNITVNAGVGDPAAIGRTVVESIRAYEKRSGKVFQAA